MPADSSLSFVRTLNGTISLFGLFRKKLDLSTHLKYICENKFIMNLRWRFRSPNNLIFRSEKKMLTRQQKRTLLTVTKFILPAFPSYNSRNHVSIMESMGLKKGEMMMPADMESDPRFDVVYDWTDFRFVRDSWRKDAILSEIFRWMDDLNYQFKTHLFDVPRNAFLLVRYVPGLSWVFNKIKEIDSDLPNSAILAKLNIQTVGEILMQKLKNSDEAHFQKTGLWMSQKQLRNSLEKIRLQDLAKHLDPKQSSTFHDYLSNQPPAYKKIAH